MFLGKGYTTCRNMIFFLQALVLKDGCLPPKKIVALCCVFLGDTNAQAG